MADIEFPSENGSMTVRCEYSNKTSRTKANNYNLFAAYVLQQELCVNMARVCSPKVKARLVLDYSMGLAYKFKHQAIKLNRNKISNTPYEAL